MPNDDKLEKLRMLVLFEELMGDVTNEGRSLLTVQNPFDKAIAYACKVVA